VDRRTFIKVIAAVFAAPLASHGQAPPRAGKVARVGILMNLYAPDAGPPQALRRALRELGYIEGENIVIDWRYQLGRGDRLPALAAELVRLQPDVILADATAAIRAAMQATSTIPIVMLSSADAVGIGLVTNLQRPEGNVTGITIMLAEMSAKRLELLNQVVPNATRVGVFWNPMLGWHKTMLKEVENAARPLRLQTVPIAVRSRDDFGNAFAEAGHSRVTALFVSETMTPDARKRLIDFAAKARLPTMFMNRDYVADGGLMSYAPNFDHIFAQAAVFAAKILAGARPGDLPVQQPTTFELVVNLITARSLGISIPQSVLLRADEIIQ